MRGRLLITAMSLALGATFVGGVALATTSSAKHVKACTTSKGVLALASKNGGCPKGDHALALNVQGPKGAKGSLGPRGPRGIQGDQGPGATAATISSTDTSNYAFSNLIDIAGTDLQIQVGCRADDSGVIQINGADDYWAQGDSSYSGGGATLSYNLNGNPGIEGLPDPFSYENHSSAVGGSNIIFAASANTATMSIHMIIMDGSVTVSVATFFLVTPTACRSVATVVPAASAGG